MKLSHTIILMIITRINVIAAACDAATNCLAANGLCENDICWCFPNKGGADCALGCTNTMCTAGTDVCTDTDTCTACSGLGACDNGGTCGSSGNPTAGLGCRCAAGFAGATCSIVECDDSTNQCRNEGTCGADGLCDCAAGYSGDFCADDIDECATSTHNCINGVCVNTPGSFTCNCDGTDFAGADCGTVKCDESDNQCENGGTCGTDGLCDCADGYSGDFCADTDPCTPNPCQNEGNCTISGDGYSCDCAVGFTGVNCENGASRITTTLPLLLAALFIFKLIK